MFRALLVATGVGGASEGLCCSTRGWEQGRVLPDHALPVRFHFWCVACSPPAKIVTDRYFHTTSDLVHIQQLGSYLTAENGNGEHHAMNTKQPLTRMAQQVFPGTSSHSLIVASAVTKRNAAPEPKDS